MPQIDLDWEMGIFRTLRGFWRSVRPTAKATHDPTLAACLEGEADRWRWFASLIAGRAIRIEPARAHGGIRGDTLLLPEFVEVSGDAEVNRAFYLLRVAIDATIAKTSPAIPTDACERTAVELRLVSTAVQTLKLELPAFGDAWDTAAEFALRMRGDLDLGPRATLEDAAIRATLRGESAATDFAAQLQAAKSSGSAAPPCPLWGRLFLVEDAGDAAGANAGDDERPPAPEGEQHQAPAMDDLTVVQLSEEGITELPIHSFEKVELAEAFNGTVRQLDGTDELDDHMESLDEVDLGTLLRGGPQAHSVLQADVSLSAEVPDVDTIGPHEKGIHYDEWDERHRHWRRDWCTVYPARMPNFGDESWANAATKTHRRTIDELEGRLLAHRTERSIRRRQLDGDDLDLDAVIGGRADLRAGRTPSSRVYETRRRDNRDVATTVLLDISLSSDSWVEGRRVLDISREALLVLGEVAERLGDRLQILAFASSTRHKVRVFEVHGYADTWRQGRIALGQLSPQGYTRLGAALRHATDELRSVQARNRVLLLVSDGKPTDWDRYEGRYGIADVRMALREARGDGISVHALAIDGVARDYLPQMLGPGAWDIIQHPRDLPEALTRVYGKNS